MWISVLRLPAEPCGAIADLEPGRHQFKAVSKFKKTKLCRHRIRFSKYDTTDVKDQ
jgi:hypothetical protein